MTDEPKDGQATTSNTVVAFPKKNNNTQVSHIEEVLRKENIYLKSLHVEKDFAIVWNAIQDSFVDCGIIINQRPDCQKTVQLIIDSVRGMLSMYYGAPHSHALLADQLYDVKDGQIVIRQETSNK
jgi:hypothetical protein